MNPYEFFSTTEIKIDPGLVFVVMPFASKYDGIYQTIQKTVSNPPFNLLCKRADDITRPGNIGDDLLTNIAAARLIIADLSDNNPNVFYETGIAHTVKDHSRVILLISDITSLPFDLTALRCIDYTGSTEVLSQKLGDSLKAMKIRQFDLTLKEGESGSFPKLSGSNNLLNQVNIDVSYIGEDGVKFQFDTTTFIAGREPIEGNPREFFLGDQKPSVNLDEIPWALCYKKIDDHTVRFILGRPVGWVEQNE